MGLFYILAAFGLGALISMQPPINAQISVILGSPLLAATCSITISLAMILIARLALDPAAFQLSRLSALPWWALIGGAAGALFVIGALIVAPKLGVAAFFAFVILGQLIGAAIIDQLGGFGMAVNSITWPRAVGIGFVLLGAALTQADAWR